MDINENLIVQWEPKIQRMLSSWFVPGLTREDLAQELRIVIIKASKAFKTDKDSIFHTYLHTSMVNTIKTLISKAYKGRMICDICRKNNLINAKTCVYCLSILYLTYCFGLNHKITTVHIKDPIYKNNKAFSYNSYFIYVSIVFRKNLYELKKIENIYLEGLDVPDTTETYAQIELDDLLKSKKLVSKEEMFIQLRLEGLTMEEITEDLGESAYRIRQTLRYKFQYRNGKQKSSRL